MSVVTEAILGALVAVGIYVEGIAVRRSVEKKGITIMSEFDDALVKAETAEKSIAAEMARVASELDVDAQKIASLLASAGQPGAEVVARLQAHATALGDVATSLHNLAEAHAGDVPVPPATLPVAPTEPAPAPVVVS